MDRGHAGSSAQTQDGQGRAHLAPHERVLAEQVKEGRKERRQAETLRAAGCLPRPHCLDPEAPPAPTAPGSRRPSDPRVLTVISPLLAASLQSQLRGPAP